MVQDLDVPVEVVAVATVRDGDGLALSSRNEYLTEEQHASALVLSRALATRDVAAGRALVEAQQGVDLDYFERVDSTTFETTPDGDLIVVAARVGTTRLIDNLLLEDAT
jgi:pantoate--beta-alanine ligase